MIFENVAIETLPGHSIVVLYLSNAFLSHCFVGNFALEKKVSLGDEYGHSQIEFIACAKPNCVLFEYLGFKLNLNHDN